MTLEQTIQMLFDDHPDLFQTRREALRYLFYTPGNGFVWDNGELTKSRYENCSSCVFEGVCQRTEARKLNCPWLKQHKFCGKLGENGKAEQRISSKQYNDIMSYCKPDKRMGLLFFDKNHRDAPIFCVPNNISSDWKRGILESFEFVYDSGEIERDFKRRVNGPDLE